MSIVGMKCFSALACLALLTAHAEESTKFKTWTDPKVAAAEDPDFLIQGEFRNETMGAQIVALGDGRFEVYLLEGGLPGAGWEPGKSRTKLNAETTDGRIEARNEAGESLVLIRPSEITLSLNGTTGEKQKLPRVERESPTLGAKPPEGGIVLFDGSGTDEWENGKMLNQFLQATGATSKRLFGNYKLHLEFRTPYMPAARGQHRGNSGIYHSGRWETQILDSFGLDGLENETGGIYSVAQPRLNMCLPPLVWQTYDVDFTAAKFDAAGQRTAWPRITVKLNGVAVHENLELSKDFTASAPISKALTSPQGSIYLQNHGNPVDFRNIWIVPGK
jgi:hypothetical protein